MYELSRVRLHSVGPAGARYQDVVLDFSGVGDVVTAPQQDALFGAGIHHADGGPPRRPSPASVLFLENGGGKSVLIKLIFSVMLPGRRQVVGTTNTRVLEKFVGAKDVAHVVLEWQHVESGQRLITGKASEWRGHVASSDPANLIDSWYCFRPGAEVGLDTLPLTEDGRLLTMSGFHDRMTSLHAQIPELQLFWTRRHHEWTERLDQLGLDTELFRYQRAMNAGEGEAADAFAFNTDEAFVEFLLRAVITEEEPKDLADVVATYADNLAQRGELMTERDFVAGALDALTPLIDEERFAAAARTVADAARAELATLAGEVAARDAVETERLETLTAHVSEVADAERLAEGDHRRKQAVLTELRRLVAGMLRDEAEADKERIDAELAEAKTLNEAWRETGTVLTHLGAARKAADIRELVGSREAAGLLAHGADVAEAARAAAARGEEAAAELARREAELERVAEELAAAQTAAGEAQREAAAARDRADRAAEELTRAHRRTDALAAEPRLAELLGTDTVTLETDTPALLDRLAEARAEAEREQTTLRMDESRDERALGALGSGGLLPPPEEVQAALDVLEEAGITAWSGWRYLSTLDSAARADAVRRAPQLVAGVLLNDPAQLDRAQEVLTEHRLLPGAVIAVGTTAALADRELAEAPGVAFLVPPNPAMYDEDAADAERGAISRRQHDRQRRLAELEESIGADAALTWKLTTWREDYPPGSIAVLAERAHEADSARDAAEQAVTEAEQTTERLTGKRDDLRGRVPTLRSEARSAEDSARSLTELAGRAARLPQWAEECERAKEAAALAEQRAQASAAQAARLREQAAEHQRTADGHRRTATTARGELAEVPGGGSVSLEESEESGQAGESDGGVPSEPVDALRRAFTSASEAYARVEVGGDLRAELEQAEAAESAARVALENLDEAVRTRAGELLETPDGSDASARAAAQARAARAVETLEAERTEVIGRLATRNAELDQLPAPTGPLDTVERPRDVEHGRELIEQAADEVSAAARAVEELREQRAAAQSTLDAAKQSASGFRMLAESLAPHVPQGEQQAAFDGDVEEAQARATDLTARLTSAQQQVDEAATRVRAAADALAQYATEKRFEKLDTPVRQQVVSVRRDSLPEHAEEWAQALRPRLRTLTDDLAQIDRHRSGIVTRLQSMVEGAIRTLRSAQRVSRLPDGLGDWSGQEFLRIRFTELDDAELATALGEVVDEAAAGRTADGRDVKRDGLSLLLRGVRAAVPKGFRVDMLKPDSVLRTERQRVSEIRDVFSGGQQLTAAIILYCTLAALRANNRGRMRNPHSGVLFLDNPIGRASAGYLLELQRAVAEALGVQLVYTTGLFDAGALSEFPLIVRLRNDADLRAGRKYLSVDATVRKELDALPEPDGTARLTSARVYTKSAAG
ncbi:hypothetical protein ACZ91_24780 [Streptomyces regensis]|nr:hypothetical protein ACZ91_24780 [Streptomyces regensis]